MVIVNQYLVKENDTQELFGCGLVCQGKSSGFEGKVYKL